jgi:hypothetical protein
MSLLVVLDKGKRPPVWCLSVDTALASRGSDFADAFFAGLAFFVRFDFGCGTSVADAFFRISRAVHFVSPGRAAVVTIHRSWSRETPS